MRTKNDDAWQQYLTHRGLALDGVSHLVTADDLKAVTGREPRLLAKFDEPGELARCLREAGYGILPVQNGQYLLCPGDPFCRVPPCPTTELVPLRLPFPLETAARGEGEAQYVDLAHSAGLLQVFTGVDPLYLTIRGRERTGGFSFRVGDRQVYVDSVQIEVDGGYEGEHDILLVEAKMGRPAHLNLRQLYYPLRHFRDLAPGKRARPLLLTYDVGTTRYELHEYAFAMADDPGSWVVVKSAGYRLYAPERRRLDELVDIRPPLRSGLAPQADDFNKVVRLLEVLAADHDRSDAVAEQLGLDQRQAQYYREAAEYLGLVHAGTYWPSEAGQAVLHAGPRRRRELLARAVVNSWIVRDAIATRQPITRESVARLIGAVPGADRARYSGSTIPRRVKTIWAWLRWLSHEVGCFAEVGEAFVGC